MGRTINEIIEEQKRRGIVPIVDIMGNPTRKIFDDPILERTPHMTFNAFVVETLDKVMKRIYNCIRIFKK